MKATPALTEQHRLEAAAEVVAYAHWRLAEMIGASPEGVLSPPKKERAELEWLMQMLGSASADLLALSFPASASPEKPLPSRRARRGRKSAGQQGQLGLAPHSEVSAQLGQKGQLGRPQLRLVAVDGEPLGVDRRSREAAR